MIYLYSMNRYDFLKLTGLTSLYFMTNSLQSLYQIQGALKPSPLMPVLFLGHGSPMNAIEENIFVQGFRKTAENLPVPQVILCISAHWYTKGTLITGQEFPPTIHDFGGFPKSLYEVEYPAPGQPQFAEELKELIKPTIASLDDHWGFDHGAWSVIKHLYPKANIPMIQMSIDHQLSPAQHLELARQLKTLRNKGVLVVGSGNIIHNLGLVNFSKINEVGFGYDWAKEAHALFNQWIHDRNLKELTGISHGNQSIQLSIPTQEHYLPLLYTIGMTEESESPQLFNDHLLAGSLSMTSVRWG
jgi:4,5-DOPA dioxygenase extradiol